MSTSTHSALGLPEGPTKNPIGALYAAPVAPALRPAAVPQAPSVLLEYYQALGQALGPMHWWPARTRFEVIVGAILTQNTAWSNVEQAIGNLRRARLLTPRAIESVSTARLAAAVRPSGYFRQKAKKLKCFAYFLRKEYGGSLARMFRTPTEALREKLLAVYGIGRETADSILLYAGAHPIFVVDAYTHRILERHGLSVGSKGGKVDYESARGFFEAHLPRQAPLYNEFHALIVNAGKNWCRKRAPRCAECPLGVYLPPGSPLLLRSGSPLLRPSLSSVALPDPHGRAAKPHDGAQT